MNKGTPGFIHRIICCVLFMEISVKRGADYETFFCDMSGMGDGNNLIQII